MPGPKMDDTDWRFDVADEEGDADPTAIDENRVEIGRLVQAVRKHESLLNGLMNQEDPVSRWGKDVEERLEELEELVEGVLEDGLARNRAITAMPVSELLQGADRHIEEAETQLEIALQMSDSGKHPTKDTRDRLKAAQVHAETAKAQVSLARALTGS